MQSNVLLVWVGALLFLAGVIYMAAQPLWRGRLSELRRSRTSATTNTAAASNTGGASNTLEPRGRSSGFDLKANWLGLGLVALGSILLLAAAAM
jgi:hypothetical protein